MFKAFIPSSFSAALVACLFIVACAPQEDVVLFLVGDSTMSDKPFIDGNPERGWGQVLPLYLKGGIKVENHAKNGRSSKSFRTEGRWDSVLSKMKKGDYVIIQFGHNDQKTKDSTRYTEPHTEYRDNLIRYVNETRARDGNPILATSIMRRRFDENDLFFDTHGSYPEVVREVAKTLDVPLIDLHAQTRVLLENYGAENSKKLFLFVRPGEYPSLPDGREDNTHLSSIGAFRVCDLACKEIKNQIPELATFLKD